jgi:hypothetical protein
MANNYWMAVDEYTMWLERERTGQNADQLKRSYEELIRAIRRIDPLTLAELAEAHYVADGIPRIEIPFFHSWFSLDLVPYRLRAGHEIVDTLPMKVLVLLHLLTAAENKGTAVRVMGEWIDCRSLQHGAILGAHFSRAIDNMLRLFFSLDDEETLARAFKWGGRPAQMGDQGFLFKIFPRLPMVIIHWRGDAEFAPYSKVLYDISASNYMPTHGLVALTEFLLQRLSEG